MLCGLLLGESGHAAAVSKDELDLVRAGFKCLNDRGGDGDSAVPGNRELDLDAVDEDFHDRVGVENKLKISVRPLLTLALDDEILRVQRRGSGGCGGGSGSLGLVILCGFGAGRRLGHDYAVSPVGVLNQCRSLGKMCTIGNFTERTAGNSDIRVIRLFA